MSQSRFTAAVAALTLISSALSINACAPSFAAMQSADRRLGARLLYSYIADTTDKTVVAAR